jgi:hypothetical protein
MNLAERVAIEDALAEAQEFVREINDAEMDRLYRSGLAQEQVAEIAGCLQQRVSEALMRMETPIRTGAGRPRITGSVNSLPQTGDTGDFQEAEVVDGEIVDTPTYERPQRPVGHLPDFVAPDAASNARTVALRWFQWGHDLQALSREGNHVQAKSKEDKQAIKATADEMIQIARTLKKECR